MNTAEKRKKRILIAVFVCYLVLVLLVTLYRDFGKQKLILTPFWEWVRLVQSGFRLHWVLQIGLNILMLVPFGFLLPQLFAKCRSLLSTAAAGVLFSVLIEVTQYVLRRGFTETDDVIHNAAGAVIGYLLYRHFQGRRQG